jgi:hemerythrin-like domain-containing protein
MKITDALLGEHGVFYAQFSHLERVIPMMTDVETVVAEASLLAAGLATHAALEDELLFTALEPHLGVKAGPLAVMRMEHDQIEGELACLEEEAAELEDAQNLLLEIVQVARQHFAKEERILFAIAAQALDEQTLTHLGLQWAARRNVLISA